MLSSIRCCASARRLGQYLPVVALLLVCTWSLSFELDRLSLSVDEFVNVEIDQLPPRLVYANLVSGRDLHPPLSHLVSALWIRIFGTDEWSVRSIWVLAGVLSVAATYQLGQRLGSRRLGMLAALLMLWLSTFLLYTRFVKYYALTILLSLLVTLSFLSWIRRPRSRMRQLAYIVLLVAYLYTDYLGPATWLAISFLYVVSTGFIRNSPRCYWLLRRWIAIHGVVGLLYLPWVVVAIRQADIVVNHLATADISAGVSATVIKIIYGTYAFSVGETLFPWRYLAIAGGVAIVVSLLIPILATIRRLSTPGISWAIVYAIFGLISTGVLLSSLIQGVPFVSYANHVLFLLPFFSVWIAAGLLSVRSHALRFGLLALILSMRQQGIAHYYAGTEFHNPIYTVPIREIVGQLSKESSAADLVVAAPDIGVHYYSRISPKWLPTLMNPFSEPVSDWIVQYHPQRIWLFEFGRDRTRDLSLVDLRTYVAARCSLISEEGYSEQTLLYRRVKSLLFGREAYQYKLTVSLYQCH